MVIPRWVAKLNKLALNPLMRLIAGKLFSPFAILEHKGRKSGKLYKTPLIVVQQKDGFVIALTYGPDVDWYKNVQVAPQSTIVWHGKKYVVLKPEPLSKEEGLQAFSQPPKTILSFVGVSKFILMKYG